MKCYEEDSLKAGELVNPFKMKDPTSSKMSRRRLSIYMNNGKVSCGDGGVYILIFNDIIAPRKCLELQAFPTLSLIQQK